MKKVEVSNFTNLEKLINNVKIHNIIFGHETFNKIVYSQGNNNIILIKDWHWSVQNIPEIKNNNLFLNYLYQNVKNQKDKFSYILNDLVIGYIESIDKSIGPDMLILCDLYEPNYNIFVGLKINQLDKNFLNNITESKLLNDYLYINCKDLNHYGYNCIQTKYDESSFVIDNKDKKIYLNTKTKDLNIKLKLQYPKKSKLYKIVNLDIKNEKS